MPSTGYGPSPAQSVGALQWPGMAQMNKLKSRQDSQQNLIGSEADQSPNQLLNTGDLTPNDVGTSGDNSPGLALPCQQVMPENTLVILEVPHSSQSPVTSTSPTEVMLQG